MSDQSDKFDGVGSTYRNVVVGLTEDNKLTYTRTVAPDSTFATEWHLIGSQNYSGAMSSDVTVEGKVAVAASEHESRHVHYYTEDTDGVGNNPIGWSSVTDMGLPEGVSGFSQLALSRSVGDLDSIIGVDDTTGKIWWMTQNPNQMGQKTVSVTPPGTTEPIEIIVPEEMPPDQPWSNWMALPEQDIDDVFVCPNADGSLVVVGRNSDSDAVYVSQQSLEHPQSNTEWVAWAPFLSLTAVQVIACRGVDTRMNVFALDNGNAALVHQMVQSESCLNDYEAPVSLPEAPEALARIKVCAGQNGALYIVGVAANAGDDGMAMMWINRQEPDANGDPQWGSWTAFRHVTPGGLPGFDIYPDGRVLLFYWSTGADGDFYYSVEASRNSGDFETDLTKIGNNLRGIGHAHDLSPVEKSS